MFQTREKAEVPGGANAPLALSGKALSAPMAPFASLSFSLQSRQTQQRVAFGPPLASISAAAHIHTSPHGFFGVPLTEPSTGFAYPEEYCVLTKKNCPHLAGVGVRAKRILGLKNINVYTVGLYVEGPAARKALHKYRGHDADQVLADQAVFDDLMASHSFEKSLRLVISFGSLKRAQFVSALEERLKPELGKAKEPASTMASFESWFDGVSFKKGTEIAFASHAKGQLVAKIDGKEVGRLSSPALVQALFGIYLGRDPVSTDAKKSFGRGLAALLNE